jgi:hypothetical protein
LRRLSASRVRLKNSSQAFQSYIFRGKNFFRIARQQHLLKFQGGCGSAIDLITEIFWQEDHRIDITRLGPRGNKTSINKEGLGANLARQF